MPHNNGLFDNLADSIVRSMTYLINSYSGLFQVSIYLLMIITFCYALTKAFHAFRTLSFYKQEDLKKRILSDSFHGNTNTPLSVIAAGFFKKSKKHYAGEKEKGDDSTIVPPDAFIRDAAFQFSERYFEEKFLEPLSMTANLLPPQGFIGTIIGMVIHFLSNSGTLNSEVTIAGIATALYTTLVALSCFTFLEFIKKFFYSLVQKRIDEGLAAVSESNFDQISPEIKSVKKNKVSGNK